MAIKKVTERLHKFTKAVGIHRHHHEEHPLTLRRLILFSCLFAVFVTVFASWLFYRDPRSKYDLVRPGRRTQPATFRAEGDESSTELSKADVRVELQKLQSQLGSLKAYGDFKDDSLSDYKVLQGYLDQPITEE